MVGTRDTSRVMRKGKGTSASSAHTQMLSAWETEQEGLERHVQPKNNGKVATADVVGQLAQPE